MREKSLKGGWGRFRRRTLACAATSRLVPFQEAVAALAASRTNAG